MILLSTVLLSLQGLGHWIRVHPVRTAAALALLLLVSALVAIIISYWRTRSRRMQFDGEAIAEQTTQPAAHAVPDEDLVPEPAGTSTWRDKLTDWRRRAPAAPLAAPPKFLRHALTVLTVALILSSVAIAAAFAYRSYTNVLVNEVILPEEVDPSTTFGIDVSHYQAHINWDAVAASEHPIKFVFLRASMGFDAIDTRFRENWLGASESGFVCGAYHYFRPHEDGKAQFDNYARIVDLQEGDLYPVLDIEEIGRRSPEKLRDELQEWLILAEAKWGVKPIIYTGDNFYKNYLHGHFPDYPLWLAHYSGTPDTIAADWRIHQFTDRVRVKGVLSRVDGNYFRGTFEDLSQLRL